MEGPTTENAAPLSGRVAPLTGATAGSDGVAAPVVFLCGPVARDMTGAMLPVDAGWLAS